MRIAEIQQMQNSYFLEHGKYKQVLPYQENGELIWIDEYLGPIGAGYIVNQQRDNNGVIEIKATDFGGEDRSFDWKVKLGHNLLL